MTHLFTLILIQPLFNLLVFITALMPGHSLGWTIVLLTILIRAALIPSVAQGLKQQQRLKKLQPELKKVQTQYKDDQEKQAQEMMALYKKYDVHPLGSCIPLLIQLPLLLALYDVFRNGLDTSHFSLLYSFVPHPSYINTVFFGIDLSKPDHLFILPILAGVLQFVQSKMMLRDTMPTGDDATQRMLNTQLQYLMPALTLLISFKLPAALPLYWVVTTLFAIVQQELLFRDLRHPQAELPATAPAASIVPDRSSVSSSPAELPPTRPSGHVEVTVRRKGDKR